MMRLFRATPMFILSYYVEIQFYVTTTQQNSKDLVSQNGYTHHILVKIPSNLFHFSNNAEYPGEMA